MDSVDSEAAEQKEPEGEIEFDFSEEPELSAASEEVVEEPEEGASAVSEVPVAEESVAVANVADAIANEAPDDEYLEEDIDEEILEIFVEEADEVLGTMTDCLHAWRANVDDQKSLETLRRSYHTLKGSGRLAGAMVLGEFAWAMENMLNRVMEGKLESSPGMFSLLEQSEVTVKKLLDFLKGNADQRPPVKRLSDLAYAFADGDQLSIADVAPVGVSAEPSLTVIENKEVAVEEKLGEEVAPVEEISDESVAAEEPEAIELEVDEVEAPEVSDVIEFESSASMQIEDMDESTDAKPEAGIDPVLAQVFRKETITHLAALNEFLNENGDAESAPVDDTLHRALHTLHGSARMAGVESIAELSEPMDRLVRTLHEREGVLDAEGITLLKDFTTAVEEASENFGAEGIEEKDYSEMLSKITTLHKQALTIPLPQKDDDESHVAAGFENIEEDDELIGVFVEEATDFLSNSDDIMQRWNADTADLEVVGELQRALHTIKGGARLAGLAPVGDLTHELESALEAVTEGHDQVAEELPAIIQAGLDYLHHSIETIKDGGKVEPADDVISQIQTLNSAEEEPLVIEDEISGVDLIEPVDTLV